MMSFSCMRTYAMLGLLVASACSQAEAIERPWLVSAEQPLVVTRGSLQQRVLLTGKVDAALSIELSVPRTDQWNVAIRWLAEDGSRVEAGDRVVEFDNTAVVDQINELELALVEAAIELQSAQAKAAVEGEDKRFEVRTQKIAVGKAQLDANLPAELLSRHEAQQYALELSRAEVALANAEVDLQAVLTGAEHEAQILRIAYAKAERALEAAEQQLEALEITAPRDGLVIVGEHPWEGRKLQVGDNVWPGMNVAKLPDRSETVVEASLSDVDDGRIQAGMRASCIVDAFPETPLRGFVAGISPVAQQPSRQSSRRAFEVRVELEDDDPEVLRPGLSVEVAVVTRDEDDVLIAPRAGLDFTGETARARLAEGDEVEVEVDFCGPQACAIVSGLREGATLRAATRTEEEPS